MTVKAALALLAALPLMACASTQPPAIQTVSLPDVAVPKPAPMHFKTFRWQVLSAGDLAKAAEAHATDKDYVIIALTPNGYKALSGNMLELQRYIAEQQNVIYYLRQTLEDRAAN